jgi:histone deacetylase 1/2
MKPIRMKMAHQLIVNYGLYRKMDIYEPHWATFNEMTSFHGGDYINYIDSISKKPDTPIVKQCKHKIYLNK